MCVKVNEREREGGREREKEGERDDAKMGDNFFSVHKKTFRTNR